MSISNEGVDHHTSDADTEDDTNKHKEQFVSVFRVSKMDCPSEETMIRLALGQLRPMVELEFDIPNREVKVFHENNSDAIEQRMLSLGLGATLISTQISVNKYESKPKVTGSDSKTLIWLLIINAFMFFIEIFAGWKAQSTGLIADSIDMFADAAVYGVALYAVSRSDQVKLKAAHLSGWLQIILAFGVLTDVIRRFWFGSEPTSSFMIGFGFVALAANVLCLFLISGKRNNGAHMKSSWIFSSNDVIANVGVILAGVLVAITGSNYPDLIIGLLITMIILSGARKILQIKS